MSRPLDVIALRGLSARAIHGVLPEEHVAPQPFVVDLALWVDGSDAARSDDIAKTVSYAEVADVVATIVKGPAVRLIETLAHRIADAIVSMERVHGVEVTVHKPEAPIRQVFADVSVTVRAGRCGESGGAVELSREALEAPSLPETPSLPAARALPDVRLVPEARALPAVRVVLALGGNIGDAPKTLADAVERLIDDPRIDVLDVSPLLRTMPVLAPGQAPQDDYWNAVVLASTALGPREVLALAHELEASAKRERLERWGARTLDVDLIDYAGIEMSEADLTLPHPRARTRAFVLAPWSVIDPQARLGGERVAELLARAPDVEGIIDAVDDWLGDPGTIMAESDALIAQALEENAAATAVRPADQHPAAPLESPRASTGGKSRLDLLPEESRLGLAPSEDSQDLVWRQLWERWSAPIDMTQTRTSAAPAPAGSTASPRFSGSTASLPPAGSAPGRPTPAREEPGSRAVPVFEEASATTAAPAEGAEADAPKRRPRWLS
ncbi:dihydroneopterin aldolase, partial [Schaalia sp.]|uniref:dihydroneopterin aldolase n=1 Tax=Schaalia sp. TaxID=2691890 RepID=UPI003D1039D2